MRPHIRRRHVALFIALSPLALASVSAQTSTPRPLLETTVWGGYSTFAGGAATDKANRTGLRSLEVAIWPSARLRIFGAYENSLSLDNLALVRSRQSVPTWRGGALLNWSGNLTTVLQGARRTLPGGIGQSMLEAEQVVYLPSGTALKAGGWVGPRDDKRTEWLGHAGFNVPLGARWRAEPTVFYAATGIPGERSWRVLLNGEVRLGSDVLVALGAAGGQNRSIDPTLTGPVTDLYVRASAPIAGANRMHLLLRRERAAGARDLTTIGLGATLTLGAP